MMKRSWEKSQDRQSVRENGGLGPRPNRTGTSDFAVRTSLTSQHLRGRQD